MRCALPIVATEATLLLAEIAFRSKGWLEVVPMLVRACLGFLAGASFGCFAGEDSERGKRGCLGRHRKTSGLKDGLELAGADHGIDFGDALLNLVAVALDEAAGDNELFGRARGFVAGHFKDGIDGFLLGGVNEAAGVDDEDFGIFRTGGQTRAGAIKKAHHNLGVHEVFGTAQGNKAHGRARGWGKFAHLSIVLRIE